MRVFFESFEITDEAAQMLEATGAAHVSYGASGGDTIRFRSVVVANLDPSESYMVMERGPGNCWLETLEGNCLACGCMARQHQLNWDRKVLEAMGKPVDPLTDKTPWRTLVEDKSLYRIQCQGCDEQCHEMPPHADPENILRKFF